MRIHRQIQPPPDSRLPSFLVAERILRGHKPEDVTIADGKSKDARDGISETIAMLEKEFNLIATALMGTEEFSRTATVVSGLQMRLQKAMEAHMARQLARLNMPSKDDITALGERMMSIDDRLIRVEEMLERIAPRKADSAPDRPPRTKKPGSSGSQSGADPQPGKRPAKPSPDRPK